jgi:hypothetical protein
MGLIYSKVPRHLMALSLMGVPHCTKEMAKLLQAVTPQTQAQD